MTRLKSLNNVISNNILFKDISTYVLCNLIFILHVAG